MVCREAKTSYGNQALILRRWGRLGRLLSCSRKRRRSAWRWGTRKGLGYCHWHGGLLAHAQRDSKTEREKLTAALEIFTELNMPRERDEVRAELEKTTAADRAT